MTASIFFSWSSPDKDRVLPLRNRLRDAGLRLWEYSEDMPPGRARADQGPSGSPSDEHHPSRIEHVCAEWDIGGVGEVYACVQKAVNDTHSC